MKKIKIRNLIIGDGTTKICYPITGETDEQVLEEAATAGREPCDLAEWRIDFFHDADAEERVLELLPRIRGAIGEKPLLFVYRTKADGGLRQPDEDYYFRLNKKAMDTGMVDIIDIELEKNQEKLGEICRHAHKCGVKMLISKHIFSGTPEESEMEALLRRIGDKGADICKMAVMAKAKGDAERVLNVAGKLYSAENQIPIIAVAMGEMGQATRKLRPFSGSCITYARGRNSVSPGQLTIKELLGN